MKQLFVRRIGNAMCRIFIASQMAFGLGWHIPLSWAEDEPSWHLTLYVGPFSIYLGEVVHGKPLLS